MTDVVSFSHRHELCFKELLSLEQAGEGPDVVSKLRDNAWTFSD